MSVKGTYTGKVEEEFSGTMYQRSDYGGWIDVNRDCQNTRQEVLIQESEIPVTFKTERKCKVIAGRWIDPFSGSAFTDPSKLDIDHVVPLAEAHRSGAWSWERDKKRAFANELADPGHLVAVSARENRRKGAKDLKDYLPPNKAFQCQYIASWKGIKERWGLAMDPGEWDAHLEVAKECENYIVLEHEHD